MHSGERIGGSGDGCMELHKRDSSELFAKFLQNNDTLEQRHMINAVRQNMNLLFTEKQILSKETISLQGQAA